MSARIETARKNAWLGDVEQLQLTVEHLHDKQNQLELLLSAAPGASLITANAPTSGLAESCRGSHGSS